MRKSLLCVLISTLMFSSMEIVLKAVSNQFSPIQLNLIRSSIVKLSATLMAYSYNWSRKLNQLWHNIRWTTIA